MCQQDIRHVQKMSALLTKTDEEIIDHLVEVRGTLHHHALPRKTGSWHPEKHDAFEAETTFLAMLAFVVSQKQKIPHMYSDDVTKRLTEWARAEGAQYPYIIEAEGICARYQGSRSDG